MGIATPDATAAAAAPQDGTAPNSVPFVLRAPKLGLLRPSLASGFICCRILSCFSGMSSLACGLRLVIQTGLRKLGGCVEGGWWYFLRVMGRMTLW